MKIQGWKTSEIFRRYAITDNRDTVDATITRFKALNPAQGKPETEKD